MTALSRLQMFNLTKFMSSFIYFDFLLLLKAGNFFSSTT